MDPLPGDHDRMSVRALLLGERLDPTVPATWRRLATSPALYVLPDGGSVVVFKYGAAVFFAVPDERLASLCQQLSIRAPLAEPVQEEALLVLEPANSGSVEEGRILVPEFSSAYLQLVGEALAKCVVLSHYERQVSQSFDRIEPLAEELRTRTRPGRSARALLPYIGETLHAEQRMTARAEIRDKPDLLWEAPGLERFYVRLESEYELRERAGELERKLELLSRTTHTVLELLHNRRSLRVEWYIVILIVVEIVLTLYGFATS